MTTAALNGPARAPAPAGTSSPGTAISTEVVAKLESVTLNIDHLRAALICVGKEETRLYLNGVFLHRTADLFVRAVSTDGHRLMIANLYRETPDKPGPKWLSQGVIVPAEQLGARLSLVDKEQSHLEKGNRPVVISFAHRAKHVEISDGERVNVFRVQPIEGTFPDYMKLVAGFGGAFDGVETGEFKPTAFEPAYLKSVGEIAGKLGAKQVVAYGMPDKAREVKKGDKVVIEYDPSPTVFTFGGLGIALVVMPMRTATAMPLADRFILAPVIKASVAALKAHETRNRKAAKTLTGTNKAEAIARADSFKSRVAELLSRTGAGNVPAALPAPKPEPVKIAGPTPAPSLKTNGHAPAGPMSGIEAKRLASIAIGALSKLSARDLVKARTEATAATAAKKATVAKPH